MPLLGIFSKRQKHSRIGEPNVSGQSDVESSPSSQSETLLSLPPPRLVSSPGASSSKTRLPFNKKSPSTSGELSYDSTELSSAAQTQLPPRLSDDSSGPGSTVLRPPLKIFNLYNNSQDATSSPSMTTAEPSPTPQEGNPPRHATSPPPPESTRRSPPKRIHGAGLFSWPRNLDKLAHKSSSDLPKSQKSKAKPSQRDSFNLKSFRHVGGYHFDGRISPQPTLPDPLPSSPSFTSSPAPLRSSVSADPPDPTQRIPVAAFREAQARRSAANSPVTPVPPEPASSKHGHEQPLGPSSRVNLPKPEPSLSSSETSSEQSDSVESSEEPGNSPLRRKATITQRGLVGRGGPKSEGHGTVSRPTHTLRQRSNSTHEISGILTSPALSPGSGYAAARGITPSPTTPSAAASSDLYLRSRSSLSTSAVHVSPDANKANPIAAGSSAARRATARSHSDSSSSDSSSDSDTPLAQLMTKRPGSAMSHSSNTTARSRIPARPLIDIKTLTSGKREEGFSHKQQERDDVTPSASRGFMRYDEEARGSTSPSQTSDPPREMASRMGSPPPRPPRASPPDRRIISPSPRGSPEKQVTPSTSQADSRLAPLPTSLGPSPTIIRRKRWGKETDADDASKRSQPPMKVSPSAPNFTSSETLFNVSSNSTPSPPVQEIQTEKKSLTSPSQRKQLLSPPSVNDRNNRPPRFSPAARKSHRRSLSHGSGLDAITPGGLSAIASSGPDTDTSRATTPSSPAESWEVVKNESEVRTDIVPTPIRQRTPPPSFAVTSRPLHRPSNSASTSTSRPFSSVNPDSARPNSVHPMPNRMSAAPSSSLAIPEPHTQDRQSGSAPNSRRFEPGRTAGRSRNVSLPSIAPAIPSSANARQRTSALAPDSTHTDNNSPSLSASGNLRQRISPPPPLMTTATSVRNDLASSTKQTKPQFAGRTMPTSASSQTSAMSPTKPFMNARRESPASSTGDSSSGRVPLTPASGSDYGSGVGTGTGTGRRSGILKKPLITFEDERGRARVRDRTGGKDGGWDGNAPANDSARYDPSTTEQWRKERRRSEAKAAIELGNVINGRGPVLEDDDDDLPLNQPMGDRMSMVNPMLGNYGFVPSPTAQGWNPWQQQPFMMAPPVMQADPNLLAAHQQAMMYAKQAYQMAVAQQAIAAAGEEWERGSSVSGMGGSNLGGGMFGLGGVPFMGMAPGMGMGMGMGMMGGMQASWAPGTMLYPPGGFGSAQSDIGVATGGRGNAANWGSRSVYGESFGPPSAPATRNSMAYGESKESSAPTSRPMQRMSFASPSSQASARPGVGARPRQRTASVPSSTLFPGPPPGAPARKIAPPSSWKQRDGSG